MSVFECVLSVLNTWTAVCVCVWSSLLDKSGMGLTQRENTHICTSYVYTAIFTDCAHSLPTTNCFHKEKEGLYFFLLEQCNWHVCFFFEALTRCPFFDSIYNRESEHVQLPLSLKCLFCSFEICINFISAFRIVLHSPPIILYFPSVH